jgi:hypothetical protein
VANIIAMHPNPPFRASGFVDEKTTASTLMSST